MKILNASLLVKCSSVMILICSGMVQKNKTLNDSSLKKNTVQYKTGTSVAAEPVNIGSRLELLIDGELIDKFINAGLRLHHPVRREMVMKYDKPWEGNGCSFRTVFRDGEIYRMYYTSWHTASADSITHPGFIAYAESLDGIHWYRPNLGLIEFRGSKNNNLIMSQINGEQMLDFSVFKDANPDPSPAARYKAVGLGRMPRGIYMFQSPDGIHWVPMRNTPVIPDKFFGLENVGDSQSIIFWDVNIKQYRIYFRGRRKVTRDILSATSADLIHWSEPKWLNYPGSPEEQLYTNAIKPYYRAPHIYIGFPARYSDRGLTASTLQLPEPDLREQRIKRNQRYGTAVTDALLMVSRDAQSFYRWPEAFIKPGLRTKDNWSYGDNFIAWHLVETNSDFEDSPPELSLYATESYFTGESSQLRRYTMRIDGFASAYASLNGGEVLTKLVKFSGKSLLLNYATSGGGSLRVELQDINGKPIPGFTMSDCDIIYGDQLERKVTWNGNNDVAVLAGRPLRLHFSLADADLYSFRFSN